jgi:hypothetical protein
MFRSRDAHAADSGSSAQSVKGPVEQPGRHASRARIPAAAKWRRPSVFRLGVARSQGVQQFHYAIRHHRSRRILDRSEFDPKIDRDLDPQVSPNHWSRPSSLYSPKVLSYRFNANMGRPRSVGRQVVWIPRSIDTSAAAKRRQHIFWLADSCYRGCAII